MPSFQHSSYLSTIQDLVNSITELKQDIDLCNKIESVPHSKKLNKLNSDEGYVIKKRRRNNVNDVYVWELSYLFDLPSLVPPTYAFSVSEKKSIYQKWINCHDACWGLGVLNPKHVSHVSLETYWKAHLFAYALGFKDLSGNTIGVIPEQGEIIFFDNERCFYQDRPPLATRFSFYVLFVSMAFDWPHYRQPIGEELANTLKQYVEFLAQKKEEMSLYFTMRGIPKFIGPVVHNLQKIEDFELYPHSTFLDFYAFLYPQIAPGLDELNEIVINCMNKKRVDHGRAVFFATRGIYFMPIEEKHKIALKEWTEKYLVAPEKVSIFLQESGLSS